MKRAAFRSDAEASCAIANLISELEQPCSYCKGDDADGGDFTGDGITLKGTSPTGEPVAVRILPGHVLEVEGGGELLDTIRERGCLHER